MQAEDKAWSEYRQKFADIYDQSNYSNSAQSFAMHASHRVAEKAFGNQIFFNKVLDIGAGTGEHLAFVRHGFGSYTLADNDQKALDVAQKKLSGIHQGKLFFEKQSGDCLGYDDSTFDRIIATHVLEHLYYPHLALKEWRRVIKSGGTLTVLIPTDPGVAWRLGRHFGPRKNAIKMGIAYDYIMAREHVNSCNNLISFLRYYFPEAKERWWPFPIASMDLNLFFVFHAVVQK